MSVVMQISDHVVVLEYGRKISDGDPSFVKSDPRVIAAYLGVEDEAVEDVLVQVGDEEVIEQLDGEPDPAHGPGASSSFMAGPISDTIGHSDPDGEVMRVSPGASKAAQVDALSKRAASAPAKASKPASKSAGSARSTKASKSTTGLSISNKLSTPRGGKPDDLLLIKGIGPINKRKLNEHGIYHFDQIAAWKHADIAAVEAYLEFDGRIAREDWIGQAKQLAAKSAKPAKRGSTK